MKYSYRGHLHVRSRMILRIKPTRWNVTPASIHRILNSVDYYSTEYFARYCKQRNCSLVITSPDVPFLKIYNNPFFKLSVVNSVTTVSLSDVIQSGAFPFFVFLIVSLTSLSDFLVNRYVLNVYLFLLT